MSWVTAQARIDALSAPVPSGCREWTGFIDKWGYGVVSVARKSMRAHRAVAVLAFGPPPEDKPWALHTCDNPPCVLSAHLYWGSAKDNSRDMVGRGRLRSAHRDQTHCLKGHPFDEDNTYRPWPGRRMCRACRRVASSAAYYRRTGGRP